MRGIIRASLALGALAAVGTVHAKVLHQTTRVGQAVVDYEVVLPDHYDAQRSYPTILAFGGGPQTMSVVERTVEGTFRDQAEKRGYVVVMPAAPDGQLFFEGGARIFPAFLQQILANYKVEDDKLLVAGASNGGISAFYIASRYPRYFRSITAFPGYLPEPTPAHIDAIAGMCVHMFVGQFDELGFGTPMQQEAQVFRRQGLALTYGVESGQSHRLATLTGTGAARLFDLFDRDRHGCTHS
ncbi:MAG TPA: alpha/beta hydrolase-fold protein [Steroidobacteraceae bacterium]|jgi:predicted peptidase|nr:alpha/beta hydrolase-fold protein [Steroidobacteraceae bacterium]